MQGWEDILQHEEITGWTVYFALHYFASYCIALLCNAKCLPQSASHTMIYVGHSLAHHCNEGVRQSKLRGFKGGSY